MRPRRLRRGRCASATRARPALRGFNEAAPIKARKEGGPVERGVGGIGASMRPRRLRRGRGAPHLAARPAPQGFNEAAPIKARKDYLDAPIRVTDTLLQ